MDDAQNNWAEHAPRIRAAREKDAELIGLAFLPIIIPFGRFELAPFTIARLLWLEQLKSPFITGEEIKKADVLAFLWIFSPDFKVGAKHGRRFCRRNFFIFWKSYAKEIQEFISVHVEMMGGAGRNSKNGNIDSSWLPMMLDGFASQYHWDEKDILNLPVIRAVLYAGAMTFRLTGKPGFGFSPNADKARADFLDSQNGRQ
jgi:hypothetical protein